MSRKEQLDDKIYETQMEVFARSGWQCVHVDENGERCPRQATQLAHVLPQDTVHLAKYGPAIIHHPDNMRGTCPAHNASVQINYRSQPLAAIQHANAIRRKLEKEKQQ
jgi:hypothetical protein